MCFMNTLTRGYIELKRLDNDTKTKSISKTCTNDETKGKPRKKVPHRCIEPAHITKTQSAWCGTVHCRNLSATEPSISPSVITCTVQVNRTSWLRRNNNENFVKLQKYAFLKQNNFMRIDELLYHSSLFYKLNFVSRRQFFINIGKYPLKCKKCELTHFCTTKSIKRGNFFLIKDDFFFETCTLSRTIISF